LTKGSPVDRQSLAYDFFKTGVVSQVAETVSAEAWVPNARDEDEVVEHVIPMASRNKTMSLLWFLCK
jgi:hypothetical protein